MTLNVIKVVVCDVCSSLTFYLFLWVYVWVRVCDWSCVMPPRICSVLQQIGAPSILFHVAVEKGTRLPAEQVLRCVGGGFIINFDTNKN